MSRNESIRRLKMQDLERSARRNSYTDDPQAWRDTAWQASDYMLEQPRRGRNTLGPQEDVMEERRVRRQRVVGTEAVANSRRNSLGESFCVLFLLVVSVVAVYWFCMQQLTR
ncbi:MAG: hypothetical protein IJ498_05045 [Akkermansia sp.]|nr:hypothetical protein [Akkermansia sp.]